METLVDTWWSRTHGEGGGPVAYFSMEFGVENDLPIYSGGLGVLAGDHLKASAELGIPLVGVGLLYRGGYFQQGLDADGRQTEEYHRVDPEAVGLVREDVTVRVELGDETASANVWRRDVATGYGATVPLYLLEVEMLTDALYGGDREHRIRQELLLGVGGVRALDALGIKPSVFHMNEGHSAFLQLERLRALTHAGHSVEEALETIRRSTVFTTHTPVPAGNEIFGRDLVLEYVAPLARDAGLSDAQLFALGQFETAKGDFGLTPFALRTSAYANGVSKLHGEVAREMWANLEHSDTEIGHVTNGVHLLTWLSPALRELLEEQGVAPAAPPADARWHEAERLDTQRLWEIHAQQKRALAEVTGLDPERLTIGFARRFATYKRAGLVYGDLDRLLALPVQLVVAGKAHPQDTAGKDVMQHIVELARDHADRIVFLEDYDIGLAQTIIPGVDVWLNNPIRPLEASGTSGMKAAVNGVLNLSVLDGWWPEAYSPDVGWAIDGVSDDSDREQLYRLLEDEVVPTFADRDRWTAMMKHSIARLAPQFSMQRAVIEYAERYYIPASRAAR
ncbi:MAG TPA: alpha-glucan family phosphorylase [Gaiellaceae bacterium]|nr:alpha-glucan family phosphorylase [Gaiellaceae bacterium]